MLKVENDKLRVCALRIKVFVNALETFDSLKKGLKGLLEGKVLMGMKDPLLPAFQVLESLSILDLVVLEDLKLNTISKSLGNMVQNFIPSAKGIELEIDNISYMHIKEE